MMRLAWDVGAVVRVPLDTYPRQARQQSRRPRSPRHFYCEMHSAFPQSHSNRKKWAYWQGDGLDRPLIRNSVRNSIGSTYLMRRH